MGVRGALVAILLLGSVIVTIPGQVAATNPVVTNVTWTPWVPARGENLTIEADVSGADNVTLVSAAYCVLPPFTCILYDMSLASGTNRSGHWTTGARIRIVNPPYSGAYFNVTAIDELGLSTTTEKDYVQYGDAVDVRASLSQGSVPPGDPVTVSGTAVYLWSNETGLHANESAPARFSSVQVRIVETSATWSSTSDASGAFSIGITAPAQTGGFTVRVSVTNRTLTGSQDRNLVAATEPTPDLRVVPDSLVASPSPAEAGSTVTVSFSVENRGDFPATGVLLRLTVKDASSAELYRRDFAGIDLGAGGREDFTATWTAVGGQMTVSVTVDPEGQIAELSETNNAAAVPLTVESGPSIMLIAGVTILLVGVAVAAALVYRWRKGRSKGPQ